MTAVCPVSPLYKASDREGGFTLVEMAVSMVVLGVLISGFILGTTHFINRYRIIETKTRIDKIERSIVAYAQKNYRVPCPADPQAGTGVEINATATRPGKCFNTNVASRFVDAIGIVPWRELGLKEADIVDAWGRYFTYKPSPHLTVDFTSSEMLDNSERTLLDVHDACRSTMWYNENSTHVNRAKAMFCCNAMPKPAYMSSGTNMIIEGSTNFWNQVTAISSQEVGNLSSVSDVRDLPVNVIADTNNWIEGQENPRYGDFDNPHSVRDGKKDYSLSKANGIAFSLISHGPNGKLSFMPRQSKNTRMLAQYNTNGSLATDLGNAAELEIFHTLQISAGTTYNPKLGELFVNNTGMKENTSDDITSYMKTDELMSSVGGSSCLHAGNVKPLVMSKMAIPRIDPNRCFRRTQVNFSIQSVKAECDNALAQLESCPVNDASGSPINYSSSKTYYKYLEVTLISTRPIDNIGGSKYRCSQGGVLGYDTSTIPPSYVPWNSGFSQCYIRGHSFQEVPKADCDPPP